MTAADRAKAIAAQARSAEDAKGTAKRIEVTGTFEAGRPLKRSPQIPRYWWTVHRWGAPATLVFMDPPATQLEMRKWYPEAAGIIAIEDGTVKIE